MVRGAKLVIQLIVVRDVCPHRRVYSALRRVQPAQRRLHPAQGIVHSAPGTQNRQTALETKYYNYGDLRWRRVHPALVAISAQSTPCPGTHIAHDIHFAKGKGVYSPKLRTETAGKLTTLVSVEAE